MSTSNDTHKSPIIRFKGFSGDWEQREFFDSIHKTIDFRGRTPKKLGLDWSSNGYPALSALNVKNGYIDFSADIHYGDESLYRRWMGGNEIYKGDVLFTMEAPVGNVAQVPDDRGYILSQRTVAFIPQPGKMTKDFLAVLLTSPLVQARIKSLAAGGTAQGVSQKSLKALSVKVPKAMKEQGSISTLFMSISNAIALHQRQLDQLQTLKREFLKRLFPQREQQQPQLRFTGFDDAWEQRKLSDVVDVRSGKDYKQLQPGKIPVYGTGGYMLSVNAALSEKQDAIGIGRKGTIDHPYILRAPFWTVDTLFYAIPRKNFNLGFVDALFHLVNWKRYDESTGVPSLSKVTINSIEVKTPCLAEQEKIGLQLSKLDDSISLHQQKFHNLQKAKQRFLQTIFL
ncbi:restriction endonuclease subunit S [Schleiferilactobacillus perolens]|jgi:type I restriction enzyme S subunit|uniref:restriction endonuclease subunit S n=1 Tax=Schleiferilactobacillus perolens TaxID=100468 RepID=UPI0023562447|nr:restriction endonuclease subunit S [Schleiferilactobacillus perolens]MCI2170048.1 restriction endonuclease subunit S [Schleiferilactobacillus perolens]